MNFIKDLKDFFDGRTLALLGIYRCLIANLLMLFCGLTRARYGIY